ncbi:uncharacterized protein LOC131650119 [Vicia villosa]|uniref:uncharacterized protein LOC131650119 n=1 Tax=Vicia villosa TaxID=3911 RepID=UPI00273B7787|nr:uncharacterized protein LOC131650119 [Vicia villosa]
MIVLSLNLRGGGSRAKRKRVGYHIQQGDADICFIQETKLSGIKCNVVKELWGDNHVEWSCLDANGASGGILTMWKKDFFNPIFSFRGEGFLGICAEKEGKLIYFVNVYASCEFNTRKRSWERLCEFKNNNVKGSWCIGGDFNSITSLEERIGSSRHSYRREIMLFKDFIEEMELEDLPTIGGKFTWFKSNGKSMSRIDRFLLSDCFVDDWKVEGQYIGERDVSDHAPIWLKDNRKNWGPKPFKFNNIWFKHEEFDIFVKEEWKKLVVGGRGDYCLVEKLKTLKNRLAWWNKSVYGWIDLKINRDGREMHALDNLFVHFAGNVPDDVVAKRLKVAEDFWDNINKREGILRLKSRQLWLAEGDDNTRYFHNSLKDRRRRNAICSIDSPEGRLEGVEEVKEFT